VGAVKGVEVGAEAMGEGRAAAVRVVVALAAARAAVVTGAAEWAEAAVTGAAEWAEAARGGGRLGARRAPN
jgi:hypothetical protein